MGKNGLKGLIPLTKNWMYPKNSGQVQEPNVEQIRLIKISGKPGIAVISDQSDSVSDWFGSEFQGPDIGEESSDGSDKGSIIMNQVSDNRRVIRVPKVPQEENKCDVNKYDSVLAHEGDASWTLQK